MNKMIEKLAASMSVEDVWNVILDHYTGEAQTLTTTTEENLLAVKILLNRATKIETDRYTHICNEYVRKIRLGGNDTEPLMKVVQQIDLTGKQLVEQLMKITK